MFLKSCTSGPQTFYNCNSRWLVPEILCKWSPNLVQTLFQVKCSWNLVQVALKPCTNTMATEVFLKSCASGPQTLCNYNSKSSVPEILYKWSRNLVQPLIQVKCSWNLAQVVLKPCITTQVILKSSISSSESLYNNPFNSSFPEI